MVAKKPSVGQVFATAGAGQSHQILQLRDQVTELEAEITRLRGNPVEESNLERQIQQLTQQLEGQEGEHDIPIDLIDPDPNQPRRTVTVTMMQSRADSLRQYGQLSPVIVIPQPNGRYRLFEGELRWRSAPLVPMATLRAVFLRQNGQEPSTVFRGQLLTRLHNEDLHDLDLAEALLQDIQNHLSELLEAEDIPQRLEAGIRYLRKTGRFSELSMLKQCSQQQQQEWLNTIKFEETATSDLFALLLELHLNPASIASNIFPMLKLPDDVKQSIRTTGLESSKARAIAQVKDDEHRGELLQSTIAENLSLSEIKARIVALPSTDFPQINLSLKQQFMAATKRLQKSSVWKDAARQRKLQKLMAQIEELVGDEA